MIKGIFFDLDNTLWDFTKSAEQALHYIYEQFIEAHNIPRGEWLSKYKVHNEQLWEEYRNGKVTSNEVKVLRFERAFVDMGLPHINSHMVASKFLQLIVENTVLFESVPETLGRLQGSYILGVITNGFAVSTERLRVLGLDKFFKVIITSEATGVPKPNAEIFFRAAASVGLAPTDLAYVGDDYLTDIVGAKKAGLIAVLFNHKNEQWPEADVQPDAVIYSFHQLMDIFRIG